MIGRRIAVSCVALAVGLATAWAEDRTSTPLHKKEQDACQADVFRVCNDAVPDEPKIVDCLNKHLPDLSAACQRLIEPDPRKRTKEF